MKRRNFLQSLLAVITAPLAAKNRGIGTDDPRGSSFIGKNGTYTIDDDPVTLGSVAYICWVESFVHPGRTTFKKLTFADSFVCQSLSASSPFLRIGVWANSSGAFRPVVKKPGHFLPLISSKERWGKMTMPIYKFCPGDTALIAMTNISDTSEVFRVVLRGEVPGYKTPIYDHFQVEPIYTTRLPKRGMFNV